MTVGTGALFPKKTHSQFMDLTRSRYAGLEKRHEKKKLPPVPFTLEQFRQHALAALGGSEDGAALCRYCSKWCTLEDTAADHMVPLNRGGGMGLDNIDFPCDMCNSAKGEMTPDEYHALLEFLARYPFARKDVISRLSKAVKLAASVRRNAVRMRDMQGGYKLKQKPKSMQQELDDF